MKKIFTKELLKDICEVPDNMNYTITGLTLDSRQVKPGDLFFACQGTQLDGRQFIEQAFNKGACVVLAENNETNVEKKIIGIKNLKEKISKISANFYDYPAKKLNMIGITGTNGKTSCSHFIAQALTQLNKPCGIIGTLGSGMYGSVKAGTLTTPDPVTLQALFHDLLSQGAHAVSMEVSSHSLDQGRVNDIAFEIGIFTNLTRDHLDYHETMEAYGAAKRKLFDLSQFAVVNADDAFGKQLIANLKGKQVVAYGIKNKADIYADKIELNSSGITAHVKTPWGEDHLSLPLIGHFNLSNSLAVLASLCLLKFSLKEAVKQIGHLSSVPGRMQMLGGKNKPLVVVDYAHTPDALEKVLHALKEHGKGKLYCVFGCGGERDRGKRPLMAAIAEKYAHQIIVTDDNPRSENPSEIVQEIMKGFRHSENIIIQHDRSKAIKDVIQYATSEDCILIAGKGAETYQQIGDQKIPFSDVEKVRENLR